MILNFLRNKRYANTELIEIVPSLFLSSQSFHKGSVIVPTQAAKSEKNKKAYKPRVC
jgi:hypothetical protein